MARQRGQSPSGNIFGTIRQAIDADAQRALEENRRLQESLERRAKIGAAVGAVEEHLLDFAFRKTTEREAERRNVGALRSLGQVVADQGRIAAVEAWPPAHQGGELLKACVLFSGSADSLARKLRGLLPNLDLGSLRELADVLYAADPIRHGAVGAFGAGEAREERESAPADNPYKRGPARRKRRKTDRHRRIRDLLAQDMTDENEIFNHLQEHHPELVKNGKAWIDPNRMMRTFRDASKDDELQSV